MNPTTDVYTIENRDGSFVVLRNGVAQENNRGYIRTFRSRSSARKAISRLTGRANS